MRQYYWKIAILVVLFLANAGIIENLIAQTERKEGSTGPKYRDGVYQGKSEGFVDDVRVEVKIEKGRIKEVSVIKHSESNPQTALEEIPRRIVEIQSTESIDVITGASFTSNAILNATRQALKKALGEAPSSIEPIDDIKKSLGARTILLPTPVWVIGSYDKEGRPNMMTAAWVGICCSRPPCVTISLRKATYTFGNIMERKAFTVNIPPASYAKETAYFGRVSGRDVDKLTVTGLTSIKSDLVDAPYIQEFPLTVECKVLHTLEVGLHTMFIGEIMDVKANEFILGENGMPDMERYEPFVFAPGSSNFYRTGPFLGKVNELAESLKSNK